ncbi:MAG: hypothetical protein HYW26_05065 [Candidatus Aenigmarchaeota archaeon]|nr:hypothetical protein [Candidatus Aenigmarchaeota archaeon]
MNGRSVLSVFALVMLFSAVAFAQNIDKAIVVSDITSADFLIAKTAAEKSGVPVLVAVNGEATEELRTQLADASLSVKTVILVGGPAVIKPEAEKKIQEWGYATVRLWGTERTGTAVEAARYFWQEGANCTVLADDTKDSDADTELQSDAVTDASQEKCVLLLTPKGKLPAEVLELLGDLGVKKVRIFGEDNPERRSQLAGFEIKIRARTETENEVLNKSAKAKIVIIAAPNWRDVLGTGGVPSENSVVRIASNADKSRELIDLINGRNITDVRVVGNPALAQEIADMLSAANITVKMTSGSRSENAMKTFQEHLARWKEKLEEEKARREAHRDKIKEKMLDLLNKTEDRLSSLEIELEEINSSAAQTADAIVLISTTRHDIDAAKTTLLEVRDKINAGQLEDANRLMHHSLSTVRKDLHLLKKLLKMDEKISEKIKEEEEQSSETEAESVEKVNEADKLLAQIDKCVGKDDVEALVNKAKLLHEELQKAKAEGNQTKAAKIAVEMRDISQHARVLGDLCRKRGEVSERIQKIAERRAKIVEEVKKIREKRATPEVELEAPESATAGKDFQVVWKVKTEVPATITHTAVHYDYASHPGVFGTDVSAAESGYVSLTQEYAKGSFRVPNTFTSSITPPREGIIYLRAHALINGKNYWTGQKRAEVRAGQSQQANSSANASFTVEGDDFSLTPKKIEVLKGSLVKIMFRVSENNVYYGGLDFRSGNDKFTTGAVLPGNNKTVEFTADESFSYTSYWPASGVKKATGEIVVK